jgi:hypothetical protein
MGSTSSTAGDDLEQDREAMEQDDPTPISQHFQQQSSSIDTTMSLSAATADTPVDDIPTGAFVVPRREILTKEDLELFHGSPTYAAFFAFLDALNESVVGVVSTADCYQSEVQHPSLLLSTLSLSLCLLFD